MGWPQEAYLHLRQILTPKSRPQNGGNLLYTKSDNELYLMNADGTEHRVGDGTGVAGITVQDENSNVSTSVTQIDFQGAGVTASSGTGEVVVTIPGGSLTVQDENSNVSTAVTQIDFQGAGVAATSGTGEVIVTVAGETLPVTIIDAKGDLIVGTAADTAARRAVGSDGQVLTADSTHSTGVKWAGAPGSANPGMFSGGYYSNPWAAGSNGTTATAQQLELSPFPVYRDSTFDLLAMNLLSGATGATLRLGIYDSDANGAPNALVIDAGTVSSSAVTGFKTVSMTPTLLTAGIYWLACLGVSGGAGTGAWQGWNAAPGVAVMGFNSSNSAYSLWRSTGVTPTSALPNPLPGGLARIGAVHMKVIARVA